MLSQCALLAAISLVTGPTKQHMRCCGVMRLIMSGTSCLGCTAIVSAPVVRSMSAVAAGIEKQCLL